MKRRPAKKSESIEVRLPHAMKEAFVAHCRAQDMTASAAIRGFIDAQTSDRSASWTRFARPAMAAGMVMALAGAVAVMPAASAPNFGMDFAALDKNRHGTVSLAEYGDRKPASAACDGALALPLKRIGFDKGPRPFAVRIDDAVFASVDRNGDGRITHREFATHRLAMWHQGYASLDTDKNGALSAAEYAGAKKIIFFGHQPDLASFEELDRDRDGQVIWREYLA